MSKVEEKVYRVPVGAFIGRGKETEKLYRLEDERNAAVMEAAKELQKVLGLEDFWREALPEALLSLLENYDKRASYVAAKAYIEKYPEGRGYGT